MLASILTAALAVVCAYFIRNEPFIAGTVIVLGAVYCALRLGPRYGSEGG